MRYGGTTALVPVFLATFSLILSGAEGGRTCAAGCQNASPSELPVCCELEDRCCDEFKNACQQCLTHAVVDPFFPAYCCASHATCCDSISSFLRPKTQMRAKLGDKVTPKQSVSPKNANTRQFQETAVFISKPKTRTRPTIAEERPVRVPIVRTRTTTPLKLQIKEENIIPDAEEIPRISRNGNKKARTSPRRLTTRRRLARITTPKATTTKLTIKDILEHPGSRKIGKALIQADKIQKPEQIGQESRKVHTIRKTVPKFDESETRKILLKQTRRERKKFARKPSKRVQKLKETVERPTEITEPSNPTFPDRMAPTRKTNRERLREISSPITDEPTESKQEPVINVSTRPRHRFQSRRRSRLSKGKTAKSLKTDLKPLVPTTPIVSENPAKEASSVSKFDQIKALHRPESDKADAPIISESVDLPIPAVNLPVIQEIPVLKNVPVARNVPKNRRKQNSRSRSRKRLKVSRKIPPQPSILEVPDQNPTVPIVSRKHLLKTRTRGGIKSKQDILVKSSGVSSLGSPLPFLPEEEEREPERIILSSSIIESPLEILKEKQRTAPPVPFPLAPSIPAIKNVQSPNLPREPHRLRPSPSLLPIIPIQSQPVVEDTFTPIEVTTARPLIRSPSVTTLENPLRQARRRTKTRGRVNLKNTEEITPVRQEVDVLPEDGTPVSPTPHPQSRRSSLYSRQRRLKIPANLELLTAPRIRIAKPGTSQRRRRPDRPVKEPLNRKPQVINVQVQTSVPARVARRGRKLRRQS